MDMISGVRFSVSVFA